jgi:hypothetical protein
VDAWNAWRKENPDIRPDLSGTNLSGVDLSRADLSGVDLRGVKLSSATLDEVNLSDANLAGAFLDSVKLRNASLRKTNLNAAFLIGAILVGADLAGADLAMANLLGADLRGANLSGASLEYVNLVMADLRDADMTGCRVFGTSVWELKLSKDTKQQNLVITAGVPKEKLGFPELVAAVLDRHGREDVITVDDIEVAQFVYLYLHNEKIRHSFGNVKIPDFIDTMGKKGVLLLGRFTEGRMQILDRLAEKLRSLDYLPMIFNFAKPETKDFTETVRLMANLSHFVIVDITNPRSAPLELQATVPDYMVPFVAILEKGEDPFAMFVDLQNKYDWVLEPVIVYSSVDRLLEVFEDKIVKPAEAKFKQLLARRTKELRVENV